MPCANDQYRQSARQRRPICKVQPRLLPSPRRVVGAPCRGLPRQQIIQPLLLVLQPLCLQGCRSGPSGYSLLAKNQMCRFMLLNARNAVDIKLTGIVDFLAASKFSKGIPVYRRGCRKQDDCLLGHAFQHLPDIYKAATALGCASCFLHISPYYFANLYTLMDGFLSTVESQGFPLSVLDTQTSFSNIPYIFFYENSDGSPDFMDSDALRTAFYKTLAKYPILAGYIRMDGHGQAKVVVDKDDLNMPEYLETAVDNISYSAIKAAQFSADTWPSGVATVGPIARAGADGSLKLLNVHVVRLKNNSGAILLVNIPHYVVDGIGFFGFVNRWAELTRNPEADVPSPCFDRSEIDSHLSEERREQCDFIQKLYTTPTIPATFLAWLSPNSRGRILDKAMNVASADGHTFLATRQKLDVLAPAGSETCLQRYACF
ncbi:hypothetical protein DL89DRAFT_172081 [Linderina pennispora]|uniref:CoA-dependent acyltransferase n=1 Tax=Linderina pennispora TaxID=61395 RepID=A0A1Y1W750_9FUNG|nr:uncharacterized protein DL89DRAFT_172081 [Linderina pennispora]ORX69148.1 hypothetical protein DL89DRAFT_172081 [Linderina pennispora]